MNAFYWVAALLAFNIIACAGLVMNSVNRRMADHQAYMKEEL